ncbi:hypothetical protein CMI37_20610 [Candidatus Pacearchaeota archaeon]|nr:hypothetical protein [Candidatus Pacearchaeota archaeon]|tara:strand:- start:2837 stop:3115 length:279 start_codon:yes stop_codon:yes gene_type:complete
MRTAEVQSAIDQTLDEWKDNPDKMFAHRSRMFRTIMLILEEIITADVSGSRVNANARVRAIAQWQQVASAMEEFRMDTPVVCPHCTKEFNLE